MPPITPPTVTSTTTSTAFSTPLTSRSVFEVPTTGAPLRQRISLGGTVYVLELTWCGAANCWMLSVFNDNSVSIVRGMPLITGTDILAQLRYLGIGGAGSSMVVQSDHDPDFVPTFTSLGVTGHLFYVGPPT
jgi:hypothetical protein